MCKTTSTVAALTPTNYPPFALLGGFIALIIHAVCQCAAVVKHSEHINHGA